MEYRRLGKSGLQLSVFSFGSWVTFANQLDGSRAMDCMATAYEHGVNFFDNAEAYAGGESEVIMGEALRKLGWKRDTFCVSSKVFWGGSKPTQRGLSRKHVVDACHAALKRLQVDYLDLYFCHRPDLHTPIEETVWSMHNLVQQGKILYWGTSEWSAQQITEAWSVAKAHHLTPPTMEQPQYNLFCRERMEAEYAPLFENFGMGTTVWSPLASGILTGKYNNGIPAGSRMSAPEYQWLREGLESTEGQQRLEKARNLEIIAKDLGVSLTQMSLAWCAANPNVSTVILGASRKEQLQENLQALNVIASLSYDVMEEIEAVVENRPEPPRDYTK